MWGAKQKTEMAFDLSHNVAPIVFGVGDRDPATAVGQKAKQLMMRKFPFVLVT
jgi:hypothetical protein